MNEFWQLHLIAAVALIVFVVYCILVIQAGHLI
jgi:hypothetical protein